MISGHLEFSPLPLMPAKRANTSEGLQDRTTAVFDGELCVSIEPAWTPRSRKEVWLHSACKMLLRKIDSPPELLIIHNAFHQHQYQKVIDFDTSGLSAENALPARILQLRAQIAMGKVQEVLADVEGEDDVPDLAAVKALARYAAGDTSQALEAVSRLAESSPENATVQVLGGTVLQAAGKSEEALALLTKHSGSLEA
jgi:thioredoxin-like negative regulator of GroEL